MPFVYFTDRFFDPMLYRYEGLTHKIDTQGFDYMLILGLLWFGFVGEEEDYIL